MNDSKQTGQGPAAAGPAVPPKAWLAAVAVLLLAFSKPLYDLVLFSLDSELYSHLGLVPFVSAYLAWARRTDTPPPSAADRRLAIVPLVLGAMALAGFWFGKLSGFAFAPEDALALTTLSFVLFLGGISAWWLGRATLRHVAFPLCFLGLMAPMPLFVLNGIETALQHGSAAVAMAFFSIVGTAVFRQDLVFQLSTITLQVAPECSGIHSTLALLIVSLVAGFLYLRSPWKRVVLSVAIIPLALVRNGFRVFTLGELCVRIGPDMIDSWVHHQGGPLFFALSLIPFSLLLFLLVRSERSIRAVNRA